MRKHLLALPVLLALLAGSAAAATAQSPVPEPGVLVTEEVEPGVERIVNDGAGHDLDETHPTYRYDMDDVFVTPDGTVWLSTTYRESDNDANAPGPLVWAVGQPGTTSFPKGPFCGADTRDGRGVWCFNPATGTEAEYLASTPINAVAVAPDGTAWAVGGYGGSNGGLYRITPE